MGFSWQPITNLKEYVSNKPPGVTFFFCLLALALSFICLSVYSQTHTLPNPDVVKDWNHLLTSIAQYHLCETNNTSFKPLLPKFPSKVQKTMEDSGTLLQVQVPLLLNSKSNHISQSISLHSNFTSSQLQLEGNETYTVTMDFITNETYSCLTLRAPSDLTSISPAPPACPQMANNKEAVYVEVSTEMTTEVKCYRLMSTYDPTLQVMLTKEDQIIAERHLMEVAVALLGICLILCLSVSLTHFQSQHHRLTEQDLQEPLIIN